MIKGPIRQELTMDSVLTRTSPLDIYCHFMPYKDWELNKVTKSPFCEDLTPSFIIGNKFGEITHKAFNDDTKKGDCFNFVKQLHGLDNLDAVLRLIDKEMSLGIQSGSEGPKCPISPINKKQEVSKRNTIIQVSARKFTLEELNYWKSYYIDIQDLKDNNIYSIKNLYINRKKFSIKEDELRFGYYYPKTGHWKLYFPNKPKREKWLGNVPLTTSWGTENLKKDKNSIIGKALKDYMVIRKVYECVTGIQNESLSAFSKEFVETVKNNSKEVFYGGDNDNPGKEASYAITGAFGFKHINSPDNCPKDMADWAKATSLKTLEEHFIKKGLIT